MQGSHCRRFHGSHGLGRKDHSLFRLPIAFLTFFVLAVTRPGGLSAGVPSSGSDPTKPIPSNGYLVDAVDSDEQKADLSIAVQDGPDPVEGGAALVYTIDIANAGPDEASRLKMSDTLPLGTLYLDATGDGWACAFASGKVTCTRERLADGGTTRITLIVRAPDTGTTLSNKVMVSSATKDPEHHDNQATATTIVSSPPADLGIAMSDDPDPVDPGASLAYTLTVTNAGPGSASDVRVTDTFPADAVFVSAAGSGWTCDRDNRTIRCTTASLPVGSAAPIVVTLLAPPDTGDIENEARVASATDDPTSSNNEASESTSVVGAADLSLQQTDTPDPVPAGQRVTSLLSVANVGPGHATSVTVTDTLPPGVTFASASGGGWDCSQASGIVTCSRPALSPGEAPPISIEFMAPIAPGSITNRASIAASERDVHTSDNQTSSSTMVLAQADVNDIAVTKIKAPSRVKLKAAAPSKRVDVVVQIQNRGGHQEHILDRGVLSRLVTLDVQSMGACPGPSPTVSSFTLRPGDKLDVHFDVTFDCANDPGPGGGDYRYVATVHREVLDGRADIHPADDVCPRSVEPPFIVDPYPNGRIRDRGCGKLKPDGTKGAPVMTDVVVP